MDFDTSNQFLKFQYWFETVSKFIGYNYLPALGMSTKFKTGFKKTFCIGWNLKINLEIKNQFVNKD